MHLELFYTFQAVIQVHVVADVKKTAFSLARNFVGDVAIDGRFVDLVALLLLLQAHLCHLEAENAMVGSNFLAVAEKYARKTRKEKASPFINFNLHFLRFNAGIVKRHKSIRSRRNWHLQRRYVPGDQG